MLVVADIMGWKTVVQVSLYYALRKIVPEGWKLILTSLQENTTAGDTEGVNEDLTRVKSKLSPFTEFLLRPPVIQCSLCDICSRCEIDKPSVIANRNAIRGIEFRNEPLHFTRKGVPVASVQKTTHC
jgi:hypothetical protein